MAMRTIRHRTIRGRSAIVLAGVLGTCGGLTGIAFAVGSGTASPALPAQYEAGQRAPLATSPAASALTTLGVLRRAQTPADRIPPAIGAGLSEGVLGGGFGANIGLARRASGLTAGAAWVVPGDGSACLVANSASDANGGAICAASDRVNAGGLEMQSGTRRAPGVVFVAGVAPDGVSRVTLQLAGGAADVVAVRDNVYMAEVHGAVISTAFGGQNAPAASGPIGPARLPTAAGTPVG
jgi:hypothetical protein